MKLTLALTGVALLALSGCSSQPASPAPITHEYIMHTTESVTDAKGRAQGCVHVKETVFFEQYAFEDGGRVTVPITRRDLKAAPCGEGAIPLDPSVLRGTVFELSRLLK